MNRKQYVFTPQGGVCSRKMVIDVEEGCVVDLEIEKGCQGNSRGIVALIRGMRIDEAIARLDGITCGSKQTSCPDQLAQALKEINNKS